ncbi:MAG: methyltransferase [Rhodocyclaceae bacterium]|nr:methyltransferase [Rhodocyclaceae bacterium]
MAELSVDQLLALDRRGEARCLAEADGLRVLEAAGHRWLDGGGGAVQAVMDLADPARPCLAATRHLLAALLWQPRPNRVLNLGVGGGCIERFVAATLPTARCQSVDASAAALRLATTWFGLPPGEQVHGRAEAVLAVAGEPCDLIVCDLFEGDRHAACVADPVFQTNLAARLAPAGVVALNLSPRRETDLTTLLVALRRHLPWVILCTSEGCGNVGVLASRQPPAPARIAERAAVLSTATRSDFVALAGRFTALPPPPTEEIE